MYTKQDAVEWMKIHLNKLSHDKNIISWINQQTLPTICFHGLKHKIWHIINGPEIPKCINCDNKASWNTNDLTYRSTCGYKCSAQTNATKQQTKSKRKQTNNLKYGGNSPAASSVIRNKMSQTSIKLYGNDYKDIFAQKSKEEKGLFHMDFIILDKKRSYETEKTYGTFKKIKNKNFYFRIFIDSEALKIKFIDTFCKNK